MKKINIIWLCLSILMVAGCSSSSEAKTKKEVAEASLSVEGKKILIAYFSWADNTLVKAHDAVDPDATTSASVLPPGNTALIAKAIQKTKGGDIVSIQTKQFYSNDYDECLDQASREKAENARPALRTQVEYMDDYDIIFLGFPNWWSTCPMAIYTFLDSYDFNDKIIIPFVAHGTGGIGSSIRDLKDYLPDADFRDEFSIERESMDQVEERIAAWVSEVLD